METVINNVFINSLFDGIHADETRDAMVDRYWAEQNERMIKRHLNACGVTGDCRFDNFRCAERSIEQNVKYSSIEFCKKIKCEMNKPHILIYCGNSGSGKTHLSKSCLNWILHNCTKQKAGFEVPLSVFYSESCYLCRELDKTQSFTSSETFSHRIADFCSNDVIVIDEVFPIRNVVSWEKEAGYLFQCIDFITRHNKNLIMCTNRSFEEMSAKLGEPAVSRIRPCGQILNMTCPDKRTKDFMNKNNCVCEVSA